MGRHWQETHSSLLTHLQQSQVRCVLLMCLRPEVSCLRGLACSLTPPPTTLRRFAKSPFSALPKEIVFLIFRFLCYAPADDPAMHGAAGSKLALQQLQQQQRQRLLCPSSDGSL